MRLKKRIRALVLRAFLVLPAYAGLLLSVSMIPAQAGFLGDAVEWLFGSHPRVVQFFTPVVSGALSARDPRDVTHEVTFDIDGTGNRVVIDSGIPVVRGLVLVGILAPSTGDRPVGVERVRVDGDQNYLKIVPPPPPGYDQEEWLHDTYRDEVRHSNGCFRGFRTDKPPYLFVLDTSTLLCLAHSVDIYIEAGKGASALLPFRVVQPTDEYGRPVPSEYQRQTLGSGDGPAPSSFGGVPNSPWEWDEYLGGVARRLGYTCRPGKSMLYTDFQWGRQGPPTTTFVFLHESGQVICPRSFALVTSGRKRPYEVPADGILTLNLPGGAVVQPLIDGEAVWLAGGGPMALTVSREDGMWVPVVRTGTHWVVTSIQ